MSCEKCQELEKRLLEMGFVPIAESETELALVRNEGERIARLVENWPNPFRVQDGNQDVFAMEIERIVEAIRASAGVTKRATKTEVPRSGDAPGTKP